ncbi:MAG: glutaredoxin domain-containing protein [bacterium]|nr:glutathione S-transferase N-terminal domain-containing protein [Patescibacteria group bacterium]MDW8279641.1 glutaredoxin domain-containing protein [bacterium]
MNKVKIYTTPFCVYCQKAKEFFQKNNIFYEEIDVTQNDNALNEMIRKSGQMGVPVIEIEDNIVVGFDQNKIKQILNLV